MSLEQSMQRQACHWNRAYNTKHVIGTSIQQLSMLLEQTYNTKHVIGTSIQQ